MAETLFPGCRALAVLTVLAVVAADLAARWLGQPAPGALLLPSLDSTPGWSAFALFAVMASPRERLALLGSTLVAMPIAFAALRPILGPAAGGAFCVGVAFGAAPYALLLGEATTRSGARRRRAIDLLAACSIVHVSALAMPFFLAVTVPVLPTLCDGALVRLDAAFGVQPSGVLGLLLVRCPALSLLCHVAYGFLPVGVTICAALQQRQPGRPRFALLPTFIMAAVLGYGFYFAVPAIGPAPFFGTAFPLLRPDLAAAARHMVDTDPAHVRNAMPSLHAAWATLMLLAVRGCARSARLAAAAFLALTVIATLGLGEHYLVDLVVAAPLVLASRALCAAEVPWSDPRRMAGFALALSLLAGWGAVVRDVFGDVPDVAVLLLTAATLAASWAAERSLFRKLPRASPKLPTATRAPRQAANA